MPAHKDLNNTQQEQLDAAVFRRLLDPLAANPEVQNIDLMILADFCRNCLSKWYKAAADAEGLEVSIDQAREHIYGMKYDEWKYRYQKEATPEQIAAYKPRQSNKG